MKKEKLFTNIVYKIWKRAYPNLFKKFKNNEFYLDKPQLFFNSFSFRTPDIYFEDMEIRYAEKMNISSQIVSTLNLFSNTIIVHLESAYERALNIIIKGKSSEVLSNDNIENIMFTVIIDSLIDTILWYHNFSDMRFSENAEYRGYQVETEAVRFKIKHYFYLTNVLNCIPIILFDGHSDVLSTIEQFCLDSNDDVRRLVEMHLNYKGKIEGRAYKYRKYERIDEINLISRYIFSTYMFRKYMIDHPVDKDNPEIYNSHIEDENEIVDLIKEIESCKYDIRRIEMVNTINWKEICNINTDNIDVYTKVDLDVSSDKRLKQCRSVSKFLNLLSFSINFAFNYTEPQLDNLNEKELYKKLTYDYLPHGYTFLLEFIKLAVSINDNVLLVKTEKLNIKSLNISAGNIPKNII